MAAEKSEGINLIVHFKSENHSKALAIYGKRSYEIIQTPHKTYAIILG